MAKGIAIATDVNEETTLHVFCNDSKTTKYKGVQTNYVEMEFKCVDATKLLASAGAAVVITALYMM